MDEYGGLTTEELALLNNLSYMKKSDLMDDDFYNKVHSGGLLTA